MKRESIKTIALDLVYDVVGSILFSLGIYTFAKAAAFAPGGISGLALIVNHLWNLPIGTVTLVLNIPVILLSYRVVGRSFLLRSLRTMVISTVFLDLVFPHLPQYQGDRFLAALFTGLFLGAGLAIIYARGSSTGGTDFLTIAINKLWPHLSLGTIVLASDCVIILLGGFIYQDINAMLYGIVSTVAASTVIDKLMNGVDGGKLVIIVTTKAESVAKQISDIADRGSTMVAAKGAYSGEERQMLYCACANKQAFRVKRATHEIDPGAFIMVTDASEVYGEGFKEDPTA